MLGLYDDLSKLPQPVKVGVVGTGSIGRGIALQAKLTPGTTCVAVANRTIARAVECATLLELPFTVVETSEEMHDAIRGGKLAVCEDGRLLASCDQIDVMIESTNVPYDGAQHALIALEHDKDVVMMNHEADLMYGSYLLDFAKRRGLVYTVCDGDQPAATKRLVDSVKMMGFDLVMAGNIKGFLDRQANPTSIIPEAEKRALNHRMCVAFTDGTKLSVEMAVIANGLGLYSTVPGMYGPRMESLHDVFYHYDFESLWDGERGLVDYVLGPEPKGGVFAIGYTDVPHQNKTLGWFPVNVGKGPFYLFYRPYHLGHFESMASVAEAVLHRRAVLAPDHGFKTNVFAYARRPLRDGEALDGIGGYTCYGMIDNYDNDLDQGVNDLDQEGLPICLADHVTLKREIAEGEPILFRDVDYDATEPAIDLFFKARQVGATLVDSRTAP